jgi:CDP-glycerol glycerophosphotransferase (TagB/SpsB family)
VLSAGAADEHRGRERRVACFTRLPFLRRGLLPVARGFGAHLATSSLSELAEFAPDVVLTNDHAVIPRLRAYCDRHHAWLVGFRHGAVNKYVGADPEYALVDYFCGSQWDRDDFRAAGVWPIRDFLMTGNTWVDAVFGLPRRPPRREAPHILFAPTWNPETSASLFFGDRLVRLVRRVFPDSPITIKPHPIVAQPDHPLIVQLGLQAEFRGVLDSYRAAVAVDERVRLVTDPDLAITDLFGEADILVSDGSSLVFEFVVLERPVLLYSSPSKASSGTAPWDSRAPGNSMRGVGAEFSTHDGFVDALSRAFASHEARHRAEQRACAATLFGAFRDGRSYVRVQHALRGLPDTRVLADGPAGAAWYVAWLDRVSGITRNRTIEQPHATHGTCSPAADGAICVSPGPDDRVASARAVFAAATPPMAAGPFDIDLALPLDESADGAHAPTADVRIDVRQDRWAPRWQRYELLSIRVRSATTETLSLRLDDARAEPAVCTVDAAGTTLWSVADLDTGTTSVRLSTASGRFVVIESRVAAADEVAAAEASQGLEAACDARELLESSALVGAMGDRTDAEAVCACPGVDRPTSHPGQPSALAGIDRPQLEPLRWLPCLAAWLAPSLVAAGVERVAFFGAGSHTRALLESWQRLRSPRVVTALVSDGPLDARVPLQIRSVERFDPHSVDAVVLSSASHEGSMWRTCRSRWPWLRVVPVWYDLGPGSVVSDRERELLVARRVVPCLRAAGDVLRLLRTPARETQVAAVARAWRQLADRR